MARSFRAQRGNVFFMILLGVVLFAAITAAVVTTSRSGGKNISDEKARLLAGQILRYTSQIKGGVDLLQQNGVTETDIRVAHPKLYSSLYGDITDTPSRQVFAEEGGGVPYVSPDKSVQTAFYEWEFYSSLSFNGVGTSAGELTLTLPNVQDKVCVEINKMVNLSTATTVPTVDGDCPYVTYGSGTVSGTFSNTKVTNGSGGGIAPAESCVYCNVVWGNVYYKVLLER